MGLFNALVALFRAALLSLSALAVVNASTTRYHSPATSKSFAGVNDYFLHGTSHEDQSRYVKTIASWGVKVVRLWVMHAPGTCLNGSSTANISALELPGSLGTYQTKLLDAVDDTLATLHKHGSKAIISLYDAGSINGSNGCDTYCTAYHNSDTFYTSASASRAYDARLTAILSHRSKNFHNKPWSSLSTAILAFDIQNEPLIGSVGLLNASLAATPVNSSNIAKNDVAGNRLCDRARHMKRLIGSDHGEGEGVQVATSGVGGSEYCCNHEFNTLPAALACPDIDIVSVHEYMTSASQLS